MRVTCEFIDAGLSDAGALNTEQMDILGVSRPLLKGWKDRAVGRVLPQADADRFIALKGASKYQRRRAQQRAEIPVDGPGDEDRRRAREFLRSISDYLKPDVLEAAKESPDAYGILPTLAHVIWRARRDGAVQ